MTTFRSRMGTTASLQDERARRAEAAIGGLAASYLGAPPGTDVSVVVRLRDLDQAWGVRLTDRGCEVTDSAPRQPDAEILTDTDTFVAIREGGMIGVEAFARGRIEARGDVELVVGFEGHFRRVNGLPPVARVRRVAVPGCDVSAFTAGEGREHVVCLHGLGGNKLSFFETVAALAGEHTVHALDLPGFGSSSKPARAAYDAPFFARIVRRYLDATGISSAHLVGNSMGGRIAIELALTAPSRVRSLSLLSPALAFLRRRELTPLVKLLRPELAAIPHPMVSAIVRRTLRDLFADPDALSSTIEEIGVNSFCQAYRSRAARIAFYASARNIYLESPHGEPGFWQRLAGLETPALFVWGDHDRLVPAAFARHVERALPEARSVILDDCGHVPQIERPAQTNALIAEQVGASSAANRLSPWLSRRWLRRQAATAITATRP